MRLFGARIKVARYPVTVLGMELGTSARAAQNCAAISLALVIVSYFKLNFLIEITEDVIHTNH